VSRVASYPIALPKGVSVELSDSQIKVKGAKGELAHQLHPLVEITLEEEKLHFKQREKTLKAGANAGTMRAKVANMVQGVSQAFVKKLELRGVGYRAQLQGKVVQLTLGYSHPVKYELPEGVSAEAPSQTELSIVGIDKQVVGQVAANIRALRPPECYQGKGVRYADEHVPLKETKKK